MDIKTVCDFHQSGKKLKYLFPLTCNRLNLLGFALMAVRERLKA